MWFRRHFLCRNCYHTYLHSIYICVKYAVKNNDMKRELQDYVWSVLPKEFKEEVKYKYNKTKTKKIRKECDLGFLNAHEGMFGAHNLTSDAEGEEMLAVSRKKVQEFYAKCKEVTMNPKSYPDYAHESALSRMALLDILFGSKCLSDEPTIANNATVKEPKPSEPTANYVRVDYHGADTAAATIADSCQSQPVTDCHDFDRIVKDGFRGHNRLHIAAQIVAAIYANHQAAKGFKSIEELVHKALDIADTLIKESEKGGK